MHEEVEYVMVGPCCRLLGTNALSNDDIMPDIHLFRIEFPLDGPGLYNVSSTVRPI